MLLELFGETGLCTHETSCCDVCISNNGRAKQPFNEELKILVDALKQIGRKGEVKVVEWICGSLVEWINAYNNHSLMAITRAIHLTNGDCSCANAMFWD